MITASRVADDAPIRYICYAKRSAAGPGDIAYIRYAIVYLGLDDLKSVRDEINQLLES